MIMKAVRIQQKDRGEKGRKIGKRESYVGEKKGGGRKDEREIQ